MEPAINHGLDNNTLGEDNQYGSPDDMDTTDASPVAIPLGDPNGSQNAATPQVASAVEDHRGAYRNTPRGQQQQLLRPAIHDTRTDISMQPPRGKKIPSVFKINRQLRNSLDNRRRPSSRRQVPQLTSGSSNQGNNQRLGDSNDGLDDDEASIDPSLRKGREEGSRVELVCYMKHQTPI